MKFLLIILLFFFAVPVFAQTETDRELAQYYYTNGEFDKAISYYQKLYDTDPSRFHFNRLYECLISQKEIKSAEKLIKKQISLNKYEIDYQVILGQFHEETGEPDKAQKIYNDLIDNLSADAGSIIALFNSFKGKGRNDLALATIEKGRKLLKDSYPLHIQFADLYGATGQTDKMISEYINLIEFHSGYLSSVQTLLSRQFDLSDENLIEYDLIKKAILEKTQKNPNDVVFSEMLIWLFIQRKNFNGALIQAQAMDKRQEGQGQKVFELGNICVENQDYVSARKAFQYIIDLGSEKLYYFHAGNALLNTRFLEVTKGKSFTQEDLNATITAYNGAIAKQRNKRTAFQLILELAHIEAFYADRSDSAILRLDEALLIPGLTDIQKAEIKMQLADIHVLHGDIWEASLLYMQVESEFKYETIGHEAKFKNARIFYYDGEFDFAQSQLSVLKESTSKLIANDALKLSLLITDNFGLDSNYQAMIWFAQGDLLIEQHKFELAFELLDSITEVYPYHQLGDEVLLRKANAMLKMGEWLKAKSFLEELLKYYREDILADDALFTLATIAEENELDNVRASELYKQILFEIPGSLYSDEARKRFRRLRGEPVEDEL